MAGKVILLAGTKKGAFILESDERRKDWALRGPFCETWPVYGVSYDPHNGNIYAGGGSEWYGPAVWRSPDLGQSWSHSSEGISYGEGADPIKNVWNVTPARDALYAGVDPAGLFRSTDKGDTWTHISGLQEHRSRPTWQPGNAGLVLHSILPHPSDAAQMWVGISSVGVFHTADGGKTWAARNKGVKAEFLPDPDVETGQCPHSLALAAGSGDRIYQRHHYTVYRSDDGAQSWTDINAGLPSNYGFASAAHPHDPDTCYVLPLNGDSIGRYMPDGQGQVWRTRDAGKSWHQLSRGLPQENAYLGVYRQAMATDRLDPAGVYFGTTTGELYVSADEGESWSQAAAYLPPIMSVAAAQVR